MDRFSELLCLRGAGEREQGQGERYNNQSDETMTVHDPTSFKLR